MTAISQFDQKRRRASEFLGELQDLLTDLAHRLRVCRKCQGCKLNARRTRNNRGETEDSRDDSSSFGA